MSSNDPLFGIIIFIGIIGSAALIDYGRNRYRERKRAQSLGNLAKSYEFVGLTEGVNEFLALSHNPIPTLQFIAKAYIQSGNTQEAIKIYLSILENLKTHNKSADYKIEILHSLGVAYFVAGFLQRAKDIFIEILKNYPRNPEVLLYLLKTYESLSQYQNAIDTLECVEEIYHSQSQPERVFENLRLNRAYLVMRLLMNDINMSLNEKIARLQGIKNAYPKLEKWILAFFKSTRPSLFWEEMIKSLQIHLMIDLLWDFKREEVDLNLTNPQILDVYRAKGWINDNQPCEIFELENMRILNQYSTKQANLFFEYRCHSCKNIFPFENPRCSHCGELLQMDILYKIQEKRK